MLRHRLHRRMMHRCPCRMPVRQEPGQAAVPDRREGAVLKRAQQGQTCQPAGQTCSPRLRCVPSQSQRCCCRPAPWATPLLPDPLPGAFPVHPEALPRPRAQLREQEQPRKADLPARRRRSEREAEAALRWHGSEDQQPVGAPVRVPGRPRLQGPQQPPSPRPLSGRPCHQLQRRQRKRFPPEQAGPPREPWKWWCPQPRIQAVPPSAPVRVLQQVRPEGPLGTPDSQDRGSLLKPSRSRCRAGAGSQDRNPPTLWLMTASATRLRPLRRGAQGAGHTMANSFEPCVPPPSDRRNRCCLQGRTGHSGKSRGWRKQSGNSAPSPSGCRSGR